MAFVELKFALEHFCKMKSEQILGELASGFIFPHVKYDINHKREPNTSTHVNHVVYLTMQGCTKDTDFPIYVREGKSDSIYTFSIALYFITVVMYECKVSSQWPT